jgi:hypothetical protein
MRLSLNASLRPLPAPLKFPDCVELSSIFPSSDRYGHLLTMSLCCCDRAYQTFCAGLLCSRPSARLHQQSARGHSSVSYCRRECRPHRGPARCGPHRCVVDCVVVHCMAPRRLCCFRISSLPAHVEIPTAAAATTTTTGAAAKRSDDQGDALEALEAALRAVGAVLYEQAARCRKVWRVNVRTSV